MRVNRELGALDIAQLYFEHVLFRSKRIISIEVGVLSTTLLSTRCPQAAIPKS